MVEFFAATGEDFLDVLARFGRGFEALVNVVLSGEFNGAIKVYLTR